MKREQEEKLIDALAYIHWKIRRLENVVWGLSIIILSLILTIFWILTLPLNFG